jgi:two-component system response regulator RegA
MSMPSSPDPPRSLLIVEDDERLRDRLARALAERGYETRVAHDYESAVRAAIEETPEYLLVDLRMPGRHSGLEVIREVKGLDPSTVVVVLTGYGSIATAVDAIRLGAAHYLTKPADADEIAAAFAGAREPAGELTAPADHVPTLARVEWEHIQRVLADCGGNVSQAARLLGIHRRSLQRKLNKFPSPR